MVYNMWLHVVERLCWNDFKTWYYDCRSSGQSFKAPWATTAACHTEMIKLENNIDEW